MGTAPCPPGTDGAAATEDVERASNHAIAPSRFLRRTAAAHALVSLLPGTATRTTARSTVPLEAGAAGVAAVAVAAPVLKQGAVASHDTRRTAAMRARACPKGGTATRTDATDTARTDTTRTDTTRTVTTRIDTTRMDTTRIDTTRTATECTAGLVALGTGTAASPRMIAIHSAATLATLGPLVPTRTAAMHAGPAKKSSSSAGSKLSPHMVLPISHFGLTTVNVRCQK